MQKLIKVPEEFDKALFSQDSGESDNPTATLTTAEHL